jgi:hypothetical protein
VATAQVSLESYHGLTAAKEPATSLPRRLDILVDLTNSMSQPSDGESSLAAEARRQASKLLLSLPQGTEITLRAQGHHAEASCAHPERLAGPSIPTLRTAFVRQLEGLEPRAEGSLAAALAGIREDLEQEKAIRRTRVVVFTDLESHCGGDVCKEARALVEAGARLEIVALGEAPPSPCLAELETSLEAARAPWPRLAPPRPRFVIHASKEAAGGSDPVPVARGRAGEGPVEVPAGLLTMVVELDPPETIGPFLVEPGSSARVRLLDYPEARPPTRLWRVEREGEAVGEAFPPPATLSAKPE